MTRRVEALGSASGVRYHREHSEQLRLFDGTQALLRPLCASDAPMLQAGFEAASEESRYLRFFGYKRELSAAEAHTLAAVDLEQRFALGAVGAPGTPIEGMPMGVARFERFGEGRAEAAVLVIDAFQGKGLGRCLLQRLGEAAAERGLATLEFTTLAINRGLIATVKSAYEEVALSCPEPGMLCLTTRLRLSEAGDAARIRS